MPFGLVPSCSQRERFMRELSPVVPCRPVASGLVRLQSWLQVGSRRQWTGCGIAAAAAKRGGRHHTHMRYGELAVRESLEEASG